MILKVGLSLCAAAITKEVGAPAGTRNATSDVPPRTVKYLPPAASVHGSASERQA